MGNEDLKRMDEPLVSVVMPAYNSRLYLEQAIRSVMNQTYSNWELLVLDDGSKDDSCQIAQELARQDSRIRVLPNEKNMGTARTRNRGIDLSQGSYIALLDSDDIWRPGKLEKQIALAKKENADLVYCSYAIIREDGSKRCNDYMVPSSTNLNQMLKNNVIGCSTVLLSRQSLGNRRFSTEYYHEDFALWLELLLDGKKAVGLEEVQVDYRVHAGGRASNKIHSAKKRWQIYRSFMNLPVWKSTYYMCFYALSGAIKYRKK